MEKSWWQAITKEIQFTHNSPTPVNRKWKDSERTGIKQPIHCNTWEPPLFPCLMIFIFFLNQAVNVEYKHIIYIYLFFFKTSSKYNEIQIQMWKSSWFISNLCWNEMQKNQLSTLLQNTWPGKCWLVPDELQIK